MNLFLAEQISDNKGFLGLEESHHASRVLRIQPGAEVYVTLGLGNIYTAIVTSVHKKQVDFDIVALYLEETDDRRLTIAIAPTKSNDRFESFLEKATEIGVSRILPIICKNSERKVYKIERGRKLIQAAAKQSLSCWWPILEEPLPFKDLIEQISKGEIPGYIAHCEEGERTSILPQLAKMDEAIILVGPEGDFTPMEIELAISKGIIPVSLGPKRLRTETAGMAIALAFAVLN